jgi:hypothetical protein
VAAAVTVGSDVAKILRELVDGGGLLDASRLNEAGLRKRFGRRLAAGGDRELRSLLEAWRLCDLDLSSFGSRGECQHGHRDWDDCPVCGH